MQPEVYMVITPELVAAYSVCPRKAFLMLRGDQAESLHEYVSVIARIAADSRDRVVGSIGDVEVRRSSPLQNDWNASAIIDSSVIAGDLAAHIEVLLRRDTGRNKARIEFDPHLFVGTHSVTVEEKLQLALMGKIVAEASNRPCSGGVVVTPDGKSQRIALAPLASQLNQILDVLRSWVGNPPIEPPVILNNHCPICPFRTQCLSKAEREDNLTLLDRMTPKLLKKYHKKGIFTINQLSYLFRPRKSRRRGAHASTTFSLALQALALRTGKVYLHHPPSLQKNEVELFLDIEGLPDRDFQYLVGVVVCKGTDVACHSFWAESQDEQKVIFQSLIKIAREYPTAPIYHYGSYEPKALDRAAKTHGLELADVRERFVNVNSLIYAKVYFPSRSNTLKDLGRLLGATWSPPEASGLKSIAWRYQWESTKAAQLKERLLSYNLDDCHALRRLVNELKDLGEAVSRLDVDFPDRPRQHATLTGTAIHDSLEKILKSAHAEYEKNRISFQMRRKPQSKKSQSTLSRGRTRPRKAKRVVRVQPRRKCPRHAGQSLKVSTKIFSEHVLIDLQFTKNGCKKVITKYAGPKARCELCNSYYSPPTIYRLRGQIFGRNFKVWAVYQRILLRLPYRVISQAIEDQFREEISKTSVVEYMSELSSYYTSTEKRLLEKILSSPFIHVDETKLNLQGIDHYVWVLTNGFHVVFRLTETREASLLETMLEDYTGVLVTDFYGGYDAFECRQQKCLVHLIRDLNDDLWKNPFNQELERFVGSVKELLVPIMDDVYRFGLKRHFLRKHERLVNRFYKNEIDGHRYECEITERFQKRFVRYRESLFRFLTEDGIPWNNNMGERAIRHLAVQRKISGSFFKRVAPHYLRLLAINQTCRFQEKSFLRFLLSGGKDVDQFKDLRR